MEIPKQHREFHHLDIEEGWETPPGYPDGIKQKIISGSLDEVKKKGSRTRLLHISPGTFTSEAFIHDYWEEVFLFEGNLRVGTDADGKGGEVFEPLTYAVRPPQTWHGPFATETGCTVLEIHYYEDKPKKS